jgi:type II secretory pathway pseudopilin PulG
VDYIRCITSRLLHAARRQAGVTLIETVLAIALFGIVSTSLIGVLTSATAADGLSRQRSIALELAQQQVEYVRQLNYSDTGICLEFATNGTCTSGGNPPGRVPSTQSKKVSGLWYTLTTRIRYVNDPVATSFVTFANYKQVRVTVVRVSDNKQLTQITTYLSSPTRADSGSLNNGVVNVTAQDYVTHESLPGVNIALSKTWSAGFEANDTTGDEVGSPSFGLATFPGLEETPLTPTIGYYEANATLSNYATLREDKPPADPAHFQLAPSGTANKTVRLYKPSSIHVHIVNEDGSLFSGPATVTISSASRGISQQFTTSTGEYTVASTATLGVCPDCEPVVPGSDYAITAHADVTGGYREGQRAGLVVPTDPTGYSDPHPGSSFDVTLPATVTPEVATMTVYVRRIRSTHGDPEALCWDVTRSSDKISGAAVTLTSVPDGTQLPAQNPDKDGHPPFNNVPLGTYNLHASKYISGWRSGDLYNISFEHDDQHCIGVYY